VLENNKDYQAIVDLTQTIEEAEDLRKEIADLTEKKRKWESVTFDSKHKFFPYGQILRLLESEAYKQTFSKKFVHAAYTVLTYAVLFALPIGVVYLLDALGVYAYDPFFTEVSHWIGLGVFYVLLIVVTGLTAKKLFLRIGEGIDKRRYNRLFKKRKQNVADALDKSRAMIKEYKNDFLEKAQEAGETIENKTKKLDKLQEKILQNAQIPTKYVEHISAIREYFEDHRAETTKEAINLFAFESAQEAHHQKLIETLEKQNQTLSEMSEDFDKMSTLQRRLADKQAKEERERIREEEMKRKRESFEKEEERRKRKDKKEQKKRRKELKDKYK